MSIILLSRKMHIPPEVWGPFFWNTIHLVALGFSATPTYSEKRAVKEFFESLTRLIPCPICREHYTAHLKANPITVSIDSREDLFRWTVALHNTVNKMLHKATKTEVEVLHYYSELGKRNRSPVWNHEDLKEINMKSYLRGIATATITIGVIGGIFYLVSKTS